MPVRSMMLLRNQDRSSNQSCYRRKSNEISVTFMKDDHGREQQDVQSQGSDIHMPIINGDWGAGDRQPSLEKTGERC